MRWVVVLAALWCGQAGAATPEDLVRAYPQVLAGFDGEDLIWWDGTRMPIGSLADQLAARYPAGAPIGPPVGDPGRARNEAFFDKMYGDCRQGEVAQRLVRVVWLPEEWGHSVSITSVNGVDRALEAVSEELERLPEADRRFLYPIGGTFNCRVVAGTGQKSMHAWGAAIDINPAYSDYWGWRRSGEWRNQIPEEVVAVFERHGFIWGGRWAHFDTMHFEYRPELLPGR